MKKQLSGNSIASLKKAIAQRTKDFEKRLTGAKNNFEIAVVLQEMHDVVLSEVYNWTSLIDEENNNPQDGSENLINAAAAEVSSLESFLDKIKSMHTTVLPSALVLEKVLLREGKIQQNQLKTLE